MDKLITLWNETNNTGSLSSVMIHSPDVRIERPAQEAFFKVKGDRVIRRDSETAANKT